MGDRCVRSIKKALVRSLWKHLTLQSFALRFWIISYFVCEKNRQTKGNTFEDCCKLHLNIVIPRNLNLNLTER